MRKIIVAGSIAMIFALCLHALSMQAQEDSSNRLRPVPPRTHVWELSAKGATMPVLLGDTVNMNNLVQSVAVVKGKKLESTPAASPFSALAGRLAGLYISQGSGAPGADIPSILLRGRTPLILVDGVPRTTTTFNPEQIESVTILKDALSTATLGMRGMNGAILITTKKGAGQENGFTMDFKVQGGVQSPTAMRKYLGSYDYARLYNEALANDGRPPVYTQADLDAYKNRSDPYGHPDVDWTNTLLKNKALFSRYTLDATGQTKSVNYFVSLDYLNQGGLFREADTSSYSTNATYKRYIFRSNLEIKVDERLKVFLNLFGRIQNGNEPGAGTGNLLFDQNTSPIGVLAAAGITGSSSILADLNTTPNNAYPVFNPNGSFGGNINFQNNIFGKSVASGYKSTMQRDGFTDVGFIRNMDDIWKGWWIKAMISYNTSLTQQTNRSKQFQVFEMAIGASLDTMYRRYGPDPVPLQLNSSSVINRSQQFYAAVSTGLHRRLGKSDLLDITLMGSSDQVVANADLANTFKGLAANISYSIHDRYVAQLSGSYSGNNRFEPGSQYSFFPAAGVAWNIHNESFFSKNRFINALKLRSTIGQTGNSNSGYFEYLYRYTGTGGYVFGANPGSVSGFGESVPAPYNRTWEKALQFNVGVDGVFGHNRGSVSVEYYINRLSDLLINPGKTSGILGLPYPMENLGKQNFYGWEMALGWADAIRNFSYSVSANVSAVQSKMISNGEPVYPFSWMSAVGAPVGQPYGYIADGFVTEAGKGPVLEGYQSVPGDIKYKDLNNDGVINQYDATTIGHKRPLVFYGLNTGLKFRNLYLNFLIQGAYNNNQMITGNTVWEFLGNNGTGQAYPHHLGRWTPETANTATYPRLSVGGNFNNNVASTFWLQNLDFVRLKNIELGYEFHGGALTRWQLKNVRVFINALNLVTISRYKATDPEAPLANYPIQRVVNGGVAIVF